MNFNWRKPVIYSLLYLSGSKTPYYLKEIKYLNNLSIKEIKKYQEQKLRKLLMHSYKYVHYYNEVLLETEVVYDNKLNMNNWSKIPILTKDIIRSRSNDLTSNGKNQRKPYCNSSGGSTGEPVSFWQDKIYNDWNIANKIFYKLSGRQDIGEKELRIWGSERDLLIGEEKFSVRLRNWLYNRKEVNSFKMSHSDMKKYLEIWKNFQPTWIEAYIQSIYELAKFSLENDYKLPSPKGILVTAGCLHKKQYDLILEAFKTPIYNRYGSREVGDMACGLISDMSEQNLNLSPWNHYIEIVDDNGFPVSNNKEGHVIVTTLNNKTMPLIRYKIGDIARYSKQENKYQFSKVIGRDVNIFKTKTGDLIDGEFFTHEFYLKNWVKKFQVVQKNYELIHINIVGEKNKKDMDLIEIDIKKVMGNDCIIKWNFVTKIETLKNGKFLYTISEVD
jgi:phenylacetate-CoA ligase